MEGRFLSTAPSADGNSPSVDTSSTDAEPFADVTIVNLTEVEARLVHDRTPPSARAHVKRHILQAERFTVLVEDLTIPGARDLFAALTEYRANAVRDFPAVPKNPTHAPEPAPPTVTT